MKGTRAGIWTLTDKLGQGGMAEVWRGAAPDAPDVAIKLMPHAQTDGARFEAEAAALARLVHPRIIRILDFGVMNGDEPLPFLALELARGPSLDRWLVGRPLYWADVLNISRRVLEGLAHAHARGLIHRDIKPANILAMERQGCDWRLTDFGIAQSQDSVQDEHNPSGTPRYMAPEQFRGRSLDQGPWTDLYAFGCVLFELLHGQTPFESDTPIQLAFAHLRDPPPRLQARMDVPAGTRELVSVLLRKDPLARFRSAADVLRAIEKLPPVKVTKSSVPHVATADAATYVTPMFEPTMLLGDLEEFDWSPTEEAAPVLAPAQPPVEPPATSPRHYLSIFHGDTGPGLIGLRELPFVGRLEERTQLWNAFRETTRTRKRHIAVIRGAAGTGKSAIARWLTQTVVEHGLGVVASVDAQMSADAALLRAIAQLYRLEADSERASERLLRWTQPPDWAVRTIARAVAGQARAEEDVVGAALATVWAQADLRPMVLVVDNADRDGGWEQLVERIASLPHADVPLLVVITVRASPPRFAELAELDLALGAFEMGECAELITELVGLSSDEAFRIAHVVDGNPQLAFEVVHEWIDRGLLARSRGRWALASGRLPPLPASVSAVRLQQLRSVVADRPSDQRALELLACFGGPCPVALWERANQRLGLNVSGTLLARVVRAGLIERDGENLQFVDVVLRRELARSVEAPAAIHRAIADELPAESFESTPGLLGTHLVAAGDYAAAIAPLLRAVSALSSGDEVQTEQLLEMLDRALLETGQTKDEPGWRSRFHRVRVAGRRWTEGSAARELVAVMDEAESQGWLRLRCEAGIAFGHHVSARSPTKLDADRCRETVRLADTLADVELRSESRNSAGAMFGYLGFLDEAMTTYEEAREIAGTDFPVARAESEFGIGWVHFLRGALEEALAPLNRAIEGLVAVGRTRHANVVRSFTGDVLRALGRLDEAEAAFTAAYRYFSRYHLTEAVMPMNFALLAVARGDFEEARKWSKRARDTPNTRSAIMVLTDAIEVLYAAQHGDVESWDAAFETLTTAFGGDDASYDLAYLTDTAARVTAGSLDASRTRMIVVLAIDFWNRLDRNAESEAIAALL